MAKGGMAIGIRDFDGLIKKMNGLNSDSKKAVQQTMNDFKSRAPAWVGAGVTEMYAVKKARVKQALKRTKKGDSKIKLAGVKVDNVQLEYSGRLLTATGFNMKPTTRPKNGTKPYTVTAEIFKGSRKALGADVFLGSNGAGRDIPYQRVGKERTPIMSVKTLSVPQMITGKASDSIQARIEEGLTKRL